MPDVDIAPAEEDRLRALLHRAVDGLDIEADGAGPSVVGITPPRHRRRTPLLAAAAVLVVAAIGVTSWAIANRDERIDTAPAEYVDPIVIEQSGLWRLPAADSGFDVAEAMESTVRLPVQIAVDDVDDPSRLLAIVPGGYDLSGQLGVEPSAPFTEHTSMTLLRGESPDEASWLEIAGEGHTGYLTFSYVGLSDDEVQAVARSLVNEIGDTLGVLTDTARVDAALSSFQPPKGLVPTWNPDDVGIGTGAYDEDGPVTSIGLRLVGPDGERGTGVSVRRTHLPQAVAMEWHRIQATSPVTAPTTNVNGAPRRVSERTDLGRGVLIASLDGVDTVTVVTDDGTEITAQSAVALARDTSGVEPLTIQEQLDIINSLRSVGEDEFRARLDAAGVPIIDPQDLVDEAEPSADGGSAPTTTVMAVPTTTAAGG